MMSEEDFKIRSLTIDDDEIKQSKFPVLERADVLGCFDMRICCFIIFHMCQIISK